MRVHSTYVWSSKCILGDLHFMTVRGGLLKSRVLLSEHSLQSLTIWLVNVSLLDLRLVVYMPLLRLVCLIDRHGHLESGNSFSKCGSQEIYAFSLQT